MGVVDLLKCPSYSSMTRSDNFIFNPNSVHRYCPNIISYIPLAESYTWHFHVMTFVALSVGKVKSTLTLKLVVIFSVCVCHYITAYFSGCIFPTSLPITTVELYSLSDRIRKLLKFALTFLVLIHTCRIVEQWIFIFLVRLGGLIISCGK